MSKEKEQAWGDGFQAGMKEIKSMIESELSKPIDSNVKEWITEFLPKISRITDK